MARKHGGSPPQKLIFHSFHNDVGSEFGPKPSGRFAAFARA
jgi:hypothetical protein